jgi:glucose/arabinose dehydrogenase
MASPAAPSASSGPAAQAPALLLEPVVDGLREPVDVAWRPDDPSSVFVVEQGGRIRIVRDGTLVDTPFLDIGGIVTAGGEQGLLGLAFHPLATDRRFFVYYTALDGDQVVASFETMADDPDRANPDSEVILLKMADQFGNHNGGGLAFGPEGYLYISTGDGGGGGDPLDSGRHLDTPLAKVLRIDVDARSADSPYTIPADNPFVATDGARQEIWLTGLRNPWRMRFDRATGDLWIGDVGQGEREEIDVARAGVGGLDFGWNVMEGSDCFRDPGDACLTDDLTLPVTEYTHDEGCSVTGGTVYRGEGQPALSGWYVFADYCSGRFWVLDPAINELRDPTFALDSERNISAIAEDAAGELYATDHAAGELLHVVVDGG